MTKPWIVLVYVSVLGACGAVFAGLSTRSRRLTDTPTYADAGAPDASADASADAASDAAGADVDDNGIAGSGDVPLKFHVFSTSWDAGTNQFRRLVHARGEDAATVTGYGWIYPAESGATFGVTACPDGGNTAGCNYTTLDAGVVKTAAQWTRLTPNLPTPGTGNGAVSGPIWANFGAGVWVVNCSIACDSNLVMGSTDVGYAFHIRRCDDPGCSTYTDIAFCRAPSTPQLLCLTEASTPIMYVCDTASASAISFSGHYLFLEIVAAIAQIGGEASGAQGNLYVGGFNGAGDSWCYLETSNAYAL